MKKIILTLLFIITSMFINNNTYAVSGCYNTFNINSNGGTYSVCDGELIIEIPAGAVDNNAVLKTKELNEFSYDSSFFEIIGHYMNLSLVDGNGNETTFKKGVKLIFKGDKNAQNIGVAFLKGNSLTFYKDNFSALIQNSGNSNQNSPILSSTNNYELNKDTYKMYLSDITDVNGTFTTANFLLGISLESFTPISLNDQEDIKKKLDKIKELI